MATQPVLIAGQWRDAKASGTFQASNPTTRQPLDEAFPVSTWADLDEALSAAASAFKKLRLLPANKLAAFLDRYADLIEQNTDALAAKGHEETALPVSPRLAGVEIPRTCNQLRQAAAAAREGSWAMPTIDSPSGLRSILGPLGPVAIFGPNNFPFAYNGIAGGDFASAIAAGNPVIAKAHPSHPKTTQMLGQLCLQALKDSGLPETTVQLVYHMDNADGLKLVSDNRIAALGYTGSRKAGLSLKKACDDHGKLAYLEMSSINPVVILPGTLDERPDAMVNDFVQSCLLGSGQFCTNPGMVIAYRGPATETFLAQIAERFDAAPVGTLLNQGVEEGLTSNVQMLLDAGAKLLAGGKPGVGTGCSYANTLLRIDAAAFLQNPETFQTEAFGNCSLAVVTEGAEQTAQVIQTLEGNLTGCIYSASDGSDDGDYQRLAPELTSRVGRMLNDKMPTGVAVVSAQNHGGPYPATGHPGFTAVGFPASLRRFAKLTCYDNVRQGRLPTLLQDANPGSAWRWIDGQYTQSDVPDAVTANA